MKKGKVPDLTLAPCRPSTGNYIVIDIALYKNPHMLHCMSLKALQTAQSDPSYSKRFKGRPHRYVIDTANTYMHIGLWYQILYRKRWFIAMHKLAKVHIFKKNQQIIHYIIDRHAHW